jgi:hypothetical protein
MKFAKFSIVSLALSPLFALAFDIQTNLIDPIGGAITALVPILMTLALVVFIWGLIKYITSAGDPDKAKEGKSIMIWGVIALFVMASVWGLTSTIGSFLGIDQGSAPSASDLTPSE